MEPVGEAAAPTIDDLRRAGQALTDAGAREVMVFGSVAKGEVRPYSDIDLVVVLDDLDYRSRRETAYALEDLAADAIGQPVDVWLTDVPEWAAQNRCAASFAAAIRADFRNGCHSGRDRQLGSCRWRRALGATLGLRLLARASRCRATGAATRSPSWPYGPPFTGGAFVSGSRRVPSLSFPVRPI